MKFLSNLFTKKNHKDPVCGMKATDAVNTEYKGVTYYFCSAHCQEQFETSPDTYTKNEQ